MAILTMTLLHALAEHELRNAVGNVHEPELAMQLAITL